MVEKFSPFLSLLILYNYLEKKGKEIQ